MDFVSTAQEMVSGLLRLRPEWATELGDHAHDDELNDLSESGETELRRLVSHSRDALTRFDPAGLPVAARLAAG